MCRVVYFPKNVNNYEGEMTSTIIKPDSKTEIVCEAVVMNRADKFADDYFTCSFGIIVSS